MCSAGCMPVVTLPALSHWPLTLSFFILQKFALYSAPATVLAASASHDCLPLVSSSCRPARYTKDCVAAHSSGGSAQITQSESETAEIRSTVGTRCQKHATAHAHGFLQVLCQHVRVQRPCWWGRSKVLPWCTLQLHLLSSTLAQQCDTWPPLLLPWQSMLYLVPHLVTHLVTKHTEEAGGRDVQQERHKRGQHQLQRSRRQRHLPLQQAADP